MPPIGYFKFGLIFPLGTFSALIVTPLHPPGEVGGIVVVVDSVVVVVVGFVVTGSPQLPQSTSSLL